MCSCLSPVDVNILLLLHGLVLLASKFLTPSKSYLRNSNEVIAFRVWLLALSAELCCQCTSDNAVFSQQEVLGVDSTCPACIALLGYSYSITAP